MTEKNVLNLIDGADNTDIIEKYDGQIAEVTYDFNLYDHVESGQASIYRLKYVDSDNGQFIFTTTSASPAPAWDGFWSSTKAPSA